MFFTRLWRTRLDWRCGIAAAGAWAIIACEARIDWPKTFDITENREHGKCSAIAHWRDISDMSFDPSTGMPVTLQISEDVSRRDDSDAIPPADRMARIGDSCARILEGVAMNSHPDVRHQNLVIVTCCLTMMLMILHAQYLEAVDRHRRARHEETRPEETRKRERWLRMKARHRLRLRRPLRFSSVSFPATVMGKKQRGRVRHDINTCVG